MIQTTELDVNLLMARFYEKDFKFSYSSMSKLITAPKIFYNDYILKQREEVVKKYLLEGIIIHYLVLENEGFNDKFIVASDKLPGENNMLVAEKVFKFYELKNDNALELIDFRQEILDTLIDMNLHQSLKDTKDGLGDDKRIGKIVEPKTEEYFEFLKQRGSKTIIDSALLDKCTLRADIVKADPYMRELLGLDLENDGAAYGIYNELEVDMDLEDLPYGLKGIIDNLVVDVKNKTVRINDFKTTSKSLTQFSESVEVWNYWLQAVVYEKLVKSFLESVLNPSWKIEFRFIVFDKYDQLYAFEVTETTMAAWNEKFYKVLNDVNYHYNSKDYTLPADFIKRNVKL
jgi:hypothetical protein